MPVVTVYEMTAALKVTLGRKGLSDDQVKTLADYVMSFFGFGTEVVDNLLTVEDRDVFYMLEEEGILSTRQEEVHLRKGRLWRIHYWVLRTARIKELARDEGAGDAGGGFSFYDEVPEEVWARQIAAK